MSHLAPLGKKTFPAPVSMRNLIGPSFIILGVGLGSGELILWPYLVSNFGLGIIWAAVLGITMQFFINMEVERYTLARGESIFVGLARKFGRFTPYWFMATTILPWVWPGILASSATLVAKVLGIPYSGIIGIVLLLMMGGIYSLGHVVYKTQETFQKAIILAGVPFIFIVTLILAKSADWSALFAGVLGRGEGFSFLPASLPVATFLGALAYAGAGGNLNLAQSLYIREKGYGMAKYAGRIINILTGKKEKIELTGNTFDLSNENISQFNSWWKRINIEHAVVFWATSAFTILLLALLAYSTVFKAPGVETSINFVVKEGLVIGERTIPALGIFFMGMAALMLFGTQFSVYGSNARMASENLVITNQEKFKIDNLPKYFYIFLWLQILVGIGVLALGFTEPLALVVTGAVLNAMSMFIYSGLILWLNLSSLEKPLRPSLFRIAGVAFAFLFYGAFSIFVIVQNIAKFL